MTEPSIPSQNPADKAGLGSMLKASMEKYMKSVDGMLPAVVVSYNRFTNRATVAPAINMVMTNKEQLVRAQLANIPVLALGGGDFVITFPLKPGDTGWIEASDRDISTWLQGAGKRRAQPNTHRTHSFSDGRFIPDKLADYTLPPEAEGGVCLQHKDGECAIIITDSKIILKGPVEILDNVEMKKDLSVAGQSSLDGGATIQGIPFGTHKHTDVQTGSGTSGGPTS